MKEKAPIGIFDSGYGGLTVLEEIQKELPEYDFIYLGDNARAPYGTRSFEVVYQYTLEAVTKLFDMGCNLVILACNTASAKALRTIQQNDLPKIAPDKRVLGVIRPSTEIIDELSTTKHVGILGTMGTIKSMSYVLELEKLHPHIKVHQQACPLWVPLIENNEFETEGGEYFVKKYIDELLAVDSNIDCIILGCTHYPILYRLMQKHVPSNIKIIAQGSIVADSLKDYLKRHPEMDSRCSKHADTDYYTTEQAEIFAKKAGVFLKAPIVANHIEKLG